MGNENVDDYIDDEIRKIEELMTKEVIKIPYDVDEIHIPKGVTVENIIKTNGFKIVLSRR